MSCTIGTFWQNCIIDAHPMSVVMGFLAVFVVVLSIVVSYLMGRN